MQIFDRMITKFQLLQSATAIGITIGTFTSLLLDVRANPPISTSEKPISVSQPVPNNNAKTPENRKSVAANTIKVDTVSGQAETALVEYLAANDVKFYGAYWCSHCQKQKSLFGAEAAAKLLYIECAADGENSQRQLCKDKDIKYFPTWVIGGKYFNGTKDLKELAKMTGYQGLTNFKYHK